MTKLLVMIIFFFKLFDSEANNSVCLEKLSKKPFVKTSIKFSEYFSVLKVDQYKLITILENPKLKQGKKFTYLLYSKGKKPKCNGIQSIKVPIKKIALLSTTQLPILDMLDKTDSLIAFSNMKLATTKSVVERIKKGKVIDIGYPVNLELVLSLNLDVIVAQSIEAQDISGLEKLSQLGQTIIYYAAYREKSSLARAEWIKFISYFYELEERAEKIFDDIEKRYKGYKNLVLNKPKVSVLVGMNKNGIWHAPNNDSNFIQIIRDAGGNYLFDDKKSVGMLMMSVESVLTKIPSADYWLPQNTWLNLGECASNDIRYKEFDVFKNRRIFNHVKGINRWGGMNYWETAMMRPDLLLKDLIIIFYPNIFKNSHTRWYQRLK